jgi:hypothetical protein
MLSSIMRSFSKEHADRWKSTYELAMRRGLTRLQHVHLYGRALIPQLLDDNDVWRST